MGAFILFPVLMFVLFIAGVLGVTDYVHAETLVHAAAQTAVAAAAQDALAPTNTGDYHVITTSATTIDSSAASSLISSMLSGKPYITGWSCGIAGTDYSCKVSFHTSMPIIGFANGTTTSSASITFQPRKYNPPPNYCINPNTAQPLFPFSTVNTTPADNYICTLPQKAGYLALQSPAASASNPYSNLVLGVDQPVPSGFSGGAPTTPGDTAYSPTIGTYRPYGYIGLTSPQAFFDLFSTSYRENLHYTYQGNVYQVGWCNNPARFVGPFPQPISCPVNGPVGVPYWTKDLNAIPPSASAYTSIPFQIPSTSFPYLYYKPTCDNYPQSQYAPNFNNYVATCVLPYDPSYTTTVPG
ncbi:MAG: hypothetical protein ACYCU8_00145 [Ferrimicrobium acidiphilum]